MSTPTPGSSPNTPPPRRPLSLLPNPQPPGPPSPPTHLPLAPPVIAILISIALPAVGKARETSRRLKCLTNIKGIGSGLALYMNDSKDLLPAVNPLHGGDPGGGNEPSLLD